MYVAPLPDSRGSARANGKPSLSAEDAASRLVSGLRWGTAGEPVVVTYGFRASAPAVMPAEATGFERMTFQQMTAVENALKIWASVANIRFERVGTGSSGEAAYTNDATMVFAAYKGGQDGESGFAYLPGDARATSPSGDVWINTTYAENYYVVPYGYGFQTILHEIGHALGLRHPSDYDGGNPTYARDADYYEDSLQYTLMSYFDIKETGGASGSRVIPGGPLIDDIVAIQRIYGANPSNNAGNTVYGARYSSLDPTAKAPAEGDRALLDYFYGYLFEGTDRPIWGSVWDAGGIDTFDFSQSARAQRIDLRPGAFSDVYGSKKSFSIAPGVTIENAVGGGGNDEIIGNDAANILSGGGGADILYGGAGNDRLIGGAGDDLLVGAAGADTYVFGLLGGGGADRIEGFSITEDRLDMGGYRLTAVSEAGGDSILGYFGGSITMVGLTGLSLGDWNALRVSAPPPPIVMSIATTVASNFTAKVAITLSGTVFSSFGTIVLARTDGVPVAEINSQDFGVVTSSKPSPDTSIIEISLKQPLAPGTEYVLTVPSGALNVFGDTMSFTGIYGYVFSTPAAPPPVVPQFIVVAGRGVQATVAGTGTVAAGATGVQDITVRDVAGTISFGATFNEGGDRVHLTGAAAAWTAMRSGTSVILSDGDTNVVLPAGTVGTDLIFADGIRTLKIDTAAAAIMLGALPVTTSVEKVASYPGSATATGAIDASLPAQMVLIGPGPVTVIGAMTVAGSVSAAETVIVTAGSKIGFGASFNAGGDTVILPGSATSYTALRSGSTIRLTSATEEVSIPAGELGLKLSFAGGDTRTLFVDQAASAIKIGAQTIGTVAGPLSAPAAASAWATAFVVGTDGVDGSHTAFDASAIAADPLVTFL